MIPQQLRVVQAEADARAARARLADTAEALQDRLSPASLIRDARREIADARIAARRAAIDPPRPLAMGAGIAAVLVIGWPLLRWRRRRRTAARATRIRGD
ncbi:hypothetical protein [Sphingomonas bacterium]|uniref:hypothetical protein n=1 Tax=Sphingomonas bacterium TaxID=1895847 RepID=UPI0015755432|nr:hypothetical protein [Sphingomonas bacterium]